jgi:hypothetical protein
MISYFKYDDGNAFTLDSAPYSGYFHVLSGVAYSGKKPSYESRELTPKSNFLSDLYLNYAVFDGITPTIDLAVPNALDILNDNTLNELFGRIDENNLKIYKNSIFINPNNVPYDYKNTYFYTLTSTEADSRTPDDEMYGKNVYTHSDPFSYSKEWAFLDRVESGSFIIDANDNFIYYCVSDNITYALSGTFNDPSKKLTIVSQAENSVNLKIEQDYDSDELYFYTNSELLIYNLSKYEDCSNLFLKDSISISANSENIGLYTIGFNKRTEYSGNVLYLKNKYSNEILLQLSLSDLDLDNLIAIDIRKEDDNVIAVGQKNGLYYFIFFDSDDYTNTFRREELLYADEATGIEFSTEDSDFFYLKKTITQIEQSDQPRAETEIRPLLNINNRLAKARSSNFFYLNDYIINKTEENINDIQIKFNSNKMLSNSYNNLTYNTIQKNGYLYYIMHNIGRIYISKTRSSLYETYVPLNVSKAFTGIKCNTSSVGISFNSIITNLLIDTINIATIVEKVKSSTGDLANPTLSVIPTPELTYELTNLILNGNENVNVVSLQRIFTLINDLQKKLVDLS